MRFTWIYITVILLILGSSLAARRKSLDEDQERAAKEDDIQIEDVSSSEELEEVSKSEEEEVNKLDDDLPILPPIILLDFDNGTESSSDEKTKRTVNGGLGYGFDRNQLLSGRYNYYFPAGKTGTTVSIEESISPFLPKTIIEKVGPSTPRPYNSFDNAQGKLTQNVHYSTPASQVNVQSIFGQRTKLHRVPQTSTPKPYYLQSTTANPYNVHNSNYRQNFYATTSAPPSAAYESAGSYVTPSSFNRPGSHNNPSIQTSTQSPTYDSPYLRNSEQTKQKLASLYSAYANSQKTRPSHLPQSHHSYSSYTSTPGPAQNHPDPQNVYSSTPKYTVENGVRYENKIFWKYPDGRVSDVAPSSYETYSDYSGAPGAQPGAQPGDSQKIRPIYQPTPAPDDNRVLSQGPVQFPAVQDSGEQQRPSPFISSESLSSNLPQQQVYRLGYQSLIGQRPTVTLAQQAKKANPSPQSSASPAYLPSSSSPKYAPFSRTKLTKAQINAQNQKPFSRYNVDSSNAEYTDSYHDVYTPDPNYRSTTPIPSHTTPSGELKPEVLTKYTPEAQSYLKQVFAANGQTRKKPETSRPSLDNYSNLQYDDLLNYNPSISQYIRNPSSILNVRPTFVQAGNSLIPVIILRVDGAPPIQPKANPNINLKALLQQYLLQYANSVQELTRSTSYNLGQDDYAKPQSSIQPSPDRLLELARLTQNIAQETQVYNHNSYSGRSSYETEDAAPEKSAFVPKYGERMTRRQKVKNVQIIDDSRYSNYNTNS